MAKLLMLSVFDYGLKKARIVVHLGNRRAHRVRILIAFLREMRQRTNIN